MARLRKEWEAIQQIIIEYMCFGLYVVGCLLYAHMVDITANFILVNKWKLCFFILNGSIPLNSLSTVFFLIGQIVKYYYNTCRLGTVVDSAWLVIRIRKDTLVRIQQTAHQALLVRVTKMAHVFINIKGLINMFFCV